MSVRRAALLAASLVWLPAGAAAASSCADLSLVLAVDSSGSIDDAEYAFQMQATARALTSGPVREALARAGRVDIATVVWADSAESLRTLGWQVMESPADAGRAAARIAAIPRPGTGSTDMGNGIDAALDMLEGTAACPGRKVVNVVGDGRESTYPRRRSGPSVHTTRRRAETLGITINALALDSDEKDLADWFHRYVIAGADGFVLSVLDASTFEEAMIRKLVREIEPPVMAAAPAAITGGGVGAVTR